MLGGFAEFETNLRRGRQIEGIFPGKQRGSFKSRKPSIDAEEELRLKEVGIGSKRDFGQVGNRSGFGL
jgi:DNA invertase Pin-like site-specific DNA recombinase